MAPREDLNDATDPASLSRLIEHWPAAESAAVQRIHHDYFRRLAALSRRVLGQLPGARTEAEDVVQSAMQSLCRYMRQKDGAGKMDRDDIWRLLCHIVACKSRRRVQRQTRGLPNGQVRPISDFGDDAAQSPLARLPEDLSADEFDRLLAETLETLELPLQRIALLAIEGYTQAEIAKHIGCSKRTIIRKMEIVRQCVMQSLQE